MSINLDDVRPRKRPPYGGPKRSTMKSVKGYQWCDKHGMIHDDTDDPYNYGGDETDPDRCTKADRRAVYVRCAPDEEFG